MPLPRVLVLRAPGTNCDEETAHAFALAGGRAERVHVNRLLDNSFRLTDYQILCLPGGFSYGDDIAAGRILGTQLKHHLAGALAEFKAAEKLILGICNGFQILMRSGLLLEDEPPHGPPATLTWNESRHFEARWVKLQAVPSKSVFFAGIDSLDLPVAHAEGRFVLRDASVLERLEAQGQIVLRYQAREKGQTADARASESRLPPRVPYPDNPNGSHGDIAGICDATGRVCGLMPHPERYVDRLQHPHWSRRGGQDPGAGLAVFRNAVRYFG
ncbi:MAG: phosphoribosylformylglycinamidine synthase subunit PurQ [Pirellulales bacterium]